LRLELIPWKEKQKQKQAMSEDDNAQNGFAAVPPFRRQTKSVSSSFSV